MTEGPEGWKLADYLRHPPAQEAMLDAANVVRVDQDSFQCTLGGIQALSMLIEPQLRVRVAFVSGATSRTIPISLAKKFGSRQGCTFYSKPSGRGRLAPVSLDSITAALTTEPSGKGTRMRWMLQCVFVDLM